MNLYLIRHSTSENSSATKKDFDRELTEEGKELIKHSSQTWMNFIPKFDIVLTSPLKRAVQSAEIINSVFKSEKGISVENGLSSGSRTNDLIEIITTLGLEDIAVVGHQPDLSIHIFNFCGKGSIQLLFPPAAIAKIEFENRIRYASGRLSFLIPPILK